jgi:hypothetical protein
MSPPLILKRASASRPSGEWNDDDFDVLADGTVVGRVAAVYRFWDLGKDIKVNR